MEVKTTIEPVDKPDNSSGVENGRLPDQDSSTFSHEDIGYQTCILETLELDESSSDTDSEDPWDSWYTDIGYLPPLDEFTIKLLEPITSDPGMGRINPSDIGKFQEGLGERNVALKPFADIYLPRIKEFTCILDLKRSQNDPDEPILQRTIMMSMINRHRFIYNAGPNKQPVIDFAVERAWTCPPMPTRVSRDSHSHSGGKFLTQPKPDLAIAFRRDYLFPKHWQSLPPALRGLICYEGKGEAKTTCAFHFMAIEAKNSYKTLEDKVALAQCLNNASQSLHNLYEFFKEAGEEYVDVFFDQVRFFSAVLTAQGIKIRIHRAYRTREHRGEETQPAALDSIFKDYPLQFEYDDYFQADGSEFTRDKVVVIFERILVGYGINVLFGMLAKSSKGGSRKMPKAFRR
ncbi:hypothetical protein GGS24DRAFT_509025 [Hypoxylon argillaceum]|nr:hypothetical protein GGS24DRAFT_509025 [Hypoxylon argillaceum]